MSVYIFLAIFRTFDVKQYATLISPGLLVDPLDCFLSEVNRNSYLVFVFLDTDALKVRILRIKVNIRREIGLVLFMNL